MVKIVAISTQGTTELHYAAIRGDVEAVKRLLSTSNVNINSRANVSLHFTHCLVRKLRTLESRRNPELSALEHGFCPVLCTQSQYVL